MGLAELAERFRGAVADPITVQLACRGLVEVLSEITLDELAGMALKHEAIGPRIPMEITLPNWILRLGRRQIIGYLGLLGPDVYDAVLVRLESFCPAQANILALEENRSWYHSQMDVIRDRLLHQVEGETP